VNYFGEIYLKGNYSRCSWKEQFIKHYLEFRKAKTSFERIIWCTQFGAARLLQRVFRINFATIADDVNSRNDIGLACLHIACQHGHLEVVKLLLDHRAAVNAMTFDGRRLTALHFASQNGHHEIAKLLLKFKADVNATTYFSADTALHFASRNGHKDVVKLLLAHKADTSAKTFDGKKAIDLAKPYPDVVEILANHKIT